MDFKDCMKLISIGLFLLFASLLFLFPALCMVVK